MKKIFCAAYGGGHITIIDLIARRLLERSDLSLRILALTAAYGQIVDSYPPGMVRGVSDYLRAFDDRLDDILRRGAELAGEHHNPSLRIARIESLAYLGLSFTDLILEHGETQARVLYGTYGKQAFRPVRAMRRLLEFERPDLLLTTSSPRCETALLLAARELGIPNVQVLDLCGEMYPLPEGEHIVTPDQDTIDSLRRQGVVGPTFYPFGQPVLEQTAMQVAGLDRSGLRRGLGLRPEDRVLLVATARPVVTREDISVSGFLSYEEVCPGLFDALRQVATETGALVLLRIHPNENPDDYRPWLSAAPEIRLVNDTLNLSESLAVADAVLIQHSTVGSQALVCGRTVISYNHSRENPYPSRRYERPPYIYAADVSELPAALIRGMRSCQGREVDVPKCEAVDNILRLIDTLL